MKRDLAELAPIVSESQKIDRANLSEITYRRIRMALMSGEYPPGERLRIAALAEQFGVSITPVREAIFRLVSEGALAMRAATAISVPVLSAQQLREIQLTRLLLEGAMAERAAVSMTPDDIDALEAMHRAFVRAWGRDPREASQHNREFHFSLAAAGAMPIVYAVIEKMWAMMGPSIHMLHTGLKPRRLSVETHQHWAVLQALRRADAAGAREAIQEDIRLSDAVIEWTEDRTRSDAHDTPRSPRARRHA
ncbi:MAG: GntR family transcriptional regulator [Burkholderiales bacterium]